MHKALLILSLLAISGFATTTYYQELAPLWSTWKTAHTKEYSTAEEEARFGIFIENYKKVVKHNAEHTNLKLGLNKFSDLTAEEFKNYYTGYVTKPDQPNRRPPVHYGLIKAPDSIDWREKNVLNPVQDQQKCGSCWAFATVGALEAFYAIGQGQLLKFSEQQLVDCDMNNGRCMGGGNPTPALEYTAQNGMASEDDYPYISADQDCQYQGGGTVANTGSSQVNPNSVDDLKSAIATAPTTVMIEVTDIFQQYAGGIIDASQNCGAELNHAIVAVGYGDIGGQGDAFILRNSWGNWGDQGYFYISTDGSANDGAGVCGVLSYSVAVA